MELEKIKTVNRCPKCGVDMIHIPQRPGVLKCPVCHSIRFIQTPPHKPGDIEGKYRLLEPIGTSGSSELFQCCRQDHPSQRFAMKIISESLKGNRFEQGDDLIFHIHHKNIVRFFDCWSNQNNIFIVMEYIHGKTLKQIQKEGHVFSEKITLKTALAAANALCYLWEKWNLVHRDINPSNIMIDDDQQIRLIDFGIAATRDQLHANPGIDLGTPGYLSPEQFKSPREVTFTSDIFSLGATMYFLLTGHSPYIENSAMRSFQQILDGKMLPVKALNPNISDKSADLIEWMLQTDPGKRPQDWRILMEDMEDILQEKKDKIE